MKVISITNVGEKGENHSFCQCYVISLEIENAPYFLLIIIVVANKTRRFLHKKIKPECVYLFVISILV